jgi:hypothetical protein
MIYLHFIFFVSKSFRERMTEPARDIKQFKKKILPRNRWNIQVLRAAVLISFGFSQNEPRSSRFN